MLARHRHLTAFLLALLIHFLFFAPVIFYKKPEEKFVTEDKKTLNLSQFETPKRVAEATPPPKPKPKEIQKPKPQKPLPMKPSEKQIPKLIKKEQNITIAKPIEPPKPKQETTLQSINEAFKSVKPTEAKGPIKQLYGDEFERMSEAQKKFIKDNLGSIGRITERHLRYPDAAGRLSMQGRSVVEFMLHPNGDITDLKLLGSSGYRALDKNSLETIEVAYKDYPRPSQTTKIRIYVHYELY